MNSFYKEILETSEAIRKLILSPIFDIQLVESLLDQFDELCAFEREISKRKNEFSECTYSKEQFLAAEVLF
jgi:hypothetical protein